LNLLHKFRFDRRDYDLLAMLQEVLGRKDERKSLKNLLNPYLNAHGIKEMAASQSFRIAYAMANLLQSLEIGKAHDRLGALRSLRHEVMNITHSPLRHNTARILLQIMKELIREQDDHIRQLELAHDFRSALSGKPRLIRRELQRYHLLEMPEEWNQIAFDDHVHDANTKGRKTPTHLIMDAWIKGIRRLTVVYYHYVPKEAASELLEAGEIMGITIRIGVSIPSRFRGSRIRFIWVPRGFFDARDFLSFLSDPHVEAFMNEGRQISEAQKKCILDLLAEFNRTHRAAVNEAFGIELPALSEDDFLSFVASGQASILHLAEFIHARVFPLVKSRLSELRLRFAEAKEDEKDGIRGLVLRMQAFDSEAVVEEYLRPVRNPSLPDPNWPWKESDLPPLLRLSPADLIERLDRLHTGYRVCLNLSGLSVNDVLELLYDCRGRITHLEIFNLKDHVAGRAPDYSGIGKLQEALNEGNVITLKKLILGLLKSLELSTCPDRDERIAKMAEILRNIATLQSYYSKVPLKANVGSDSASRSPHLYGMGLIVRDTLKRKNQETIAASLGPSILLLPVHMTVCYRTTCIPDEAAGWIGKALGFLSKFLPGLQHLGERHLHDWEVQDNATKISEQGNLIPLGGVQEHVDQGLRLEEKENRSKEEWIWRYMNTGVRNAVKVIVGFVPAFLTFALTKDWWLLAYGGAFIWFGITGLRNILQSVLGGGGFLRSPLLRWNDYVSWGRLTDSLLFTGFSVPLLDYIVKTVLLERGLGITTATSPTALYTVMALANGLYLSGHNAFRGLPKGAIFGNFFRSVLSIPLAVVFNGAVALVLQGAQVPAVNDVLQKWAAIISKAASDCVAGMIEGFADRYENIRMRTMDYAVKIRELFGIYARLEVLFPQTDVLDLLGSPGRFLQAVKAEAQDVVWISIINALDLLYFWMYQPRARSVLKSSVRKMSEEERKIFFRSQLILQRDREISQLFLDGIIGKNFSRGLSFYLDHHKAYLENLKKLCTVA